MGKNGSGLVDPVSGASLTPTGIVSTTVDAEGTKLSLVIEGRPFLVALCHDGIVRIVRLDMKDGVGVSMPMAEFARFYAAGTDRRIAPPGSPH